MQLVLTFLCALVILIYLLHKRKNHWAREAIAPRFTNLWAQLVYIEIYRPVSLLL